MIIVGLGNPGKKYQKTRHNLGFRVTELLAEKNNFSPFAFHKSWQADLTEGAIHQQSIILIKPLTFMNSSGLTVKQVLKKKKQPLMVVHDDVDISLGKIRISQNRGAGGHKGVESIIKEIGNKNFTRIRIGILPAKKPGAVDSFVLKNFSKEEEKILKLVLEKAVLEIEKIILDKSQLLTYEVNREKP